MKIHSIEQQITDAIARLEATSIKFQTKKLNESTIFRHSGACELEVTIVPGKWFGLDFELKGTRLFCKIDTDLYDVTSPNNQKFVEGIKNDIVLFLDSLGDGRLRLGHIKGRPVLIFPQEEGLTILKQGRFLVRRSHISRATYTELLQKDRFAPLYYSEHRAAAEIINRRLLSSNTVKLDNATVQEYYDHLRYAFKEFSWRFGLASSAEEKYTLIRGMCDINMLYCVQLKFGHNLPPDMAEIAEDFDNPDYPGVPYIQQRLQTEEYLVLG